MRGNVIDLAVGVIIGAAFGAIVGSLVADIIMPVVGAVSGGLDFSNYYTALSSKVQSGLSYVDAKKQGAVLGWGQFLTVAINFLIIAWVLFLAIKAINQLKKDEPEAAAAPSEVQLAHRDTRLAEKVAAPLASSAELLRAAQARDHGDAQQIVVGALAVGGDIAQAPRPNRAPSDSRLRLFWIDCFSMYSSVTRRRCRS